MVSTDSIDSALRHDRIIVLAALSALAVVAWLYMIHEARAMDATGVCQCATGGFSGIDFLARRMSEHRDKQSPKKVLPVTNSVLIPNHHVRWHCAGHHRLLAESEASFLRKPVSFA